MKNNKLFLISLLTVMGLNNIANAKINEVQVLSNSFSPASMNVSVGDTVRWTIVSGFHTTTSTSVPAGAATWDQPISPFSPTYEYIVTKAGTYNYQCTPHGFTGAFNASAPIVNIPDNNFKAALVANLSINTNGDSEIQVSEATAFTGTIDVQIKNISDLTGIEAFTALTILNCQSNSITSLDVSKNTVLTKLDCDRNSLNSLDVSKNTALTYLDCKSNPLGSLDVSKNSVLTKLRCQSNSLVSLNIANGNNVNMTIFFANTNPNLTCIQVDNVANATSKWTVGNGSIDATASFSLQCSSTTTLFSDNFESGNNKWVLPATLLNHWIDSTATANGGDKSLYITGDGFGNNYDASVASSSIVKSINIKTTGYQNIKVTFFWRSNGEAGVDYGTVQYSTNGGNSWTDHTTKYQNQSSFQTETIALPAAAENISNLQIAFKWQNDANSMGNDPSFAIDDISINGTAVACTPPTVQSNPNNVTVTAGQSATFTVDATGSATLSYQWKKNFGTDIQVATSSSYTINQTTSNDAGIYSCVVTNACGTATSDTATLTINSSGTKPAADFTASKTSLCTNDCIDFTDNSTNAPTSWVWTFTNATPSFSFDQHPKNICFNEDGVWDVSLFVSNSSGDDTELKGDYITVNACTTNAPVANFSASKTKICANECINFTDESTNNPTSWVWTFTNATPSFSFDQHPKNICFNEDGIWDVSLFVSNSSGDDTELKGDYITVNPLPAPTITEGSGNPCLGTFLMSNSATGNQWYRNGVIINDEDKQILCLSDVGTYKVEVTDANGCIAVSAPYTVTLAGTDEFTINDLQFTISPNPSNGIFTITNYELRITNYNLKVLNVLGQVVFQSEIRNPKSEINLSTHPAGVYFLQLQTEEGIYHRKLMKE